MVFVSTNSSLFSSIVLLMLMHVLLRFVFPNEIVVTGRVSVRVEVGRRHDSHRR